MMKFKTTLIAAGLAASLLGCADDGRNGVDGIDGIDGVDGTDGTPGIDGQDAPKGLAIEVVGRFATGVYGKSAAEIVQFHQASQSVLAINAASNQIEVISLANLPSEKVNDSKSDNSLIATPFTFPSSVTIAKDSGSKTIALGDANSIAIHENLLAIAVEADVKQDNGVILFYRLNDRAVGELLTSVEVGALPDMVTFTHDGAKLLVANEGEPSKNYQVDPEGSISVIAINSGVPADSAQTISFADNLKFSSDLIKSEDVDSDEKRKALLASSGVKFASPEGTTVAQDLEPEYISVAADNKTAFVVLQENNAMGIIDLEAMNVEVKALGFKDWSQYQLDYTNKDEIAVQRSVNNLYGMFQPDAIDTFTWQDATFVVSANEGDAREYIYTSSEGDCVAAGHEYDDGDCIAYNEEVRVKDIADLMTPDLAREYEKHGGKDGLGRLKITNALGMVDTDGDEIVDAYDKLYAYGARSFSIWDQSGNLVFDSGSDFEKISASVLGANYNSAHTENKGDNRSDDKGGEPEAVVVGEINGRNYAFIALERSGDLFAYDVSNPFNVKFVNYSNNRDFTTSFELDDDLADPCDASEGMDCSQVAQSGDLGPESIEFVSASQSPNGNPLLIIGNEVSGSVTVYQVKEM